MREGGICFPGFGGCEMYWERHIWFLLFTTHKGFSRKCHPCASCATLVLLAKWTMKGRVEQVVQCSNNTL